MALEAQTPADMDVQDVLWFPGAIVPSILVEADMGPRFLLCDGRRVSKVAYPDLYAKFQHRFEIVPGVDPGDGLFRMPPMMEHTGNGSAARIPAGVDPALDDVGDIAGQLGHTHAPGSLSMPQHAHGVGTLILPSHGHGHSLAAWHEHGLFNDVQPYEGGTDSEVTGTLSKTSWNPAGETPYWVTQFAAPGVNGSVNGIGNLGLSGAPGNSGPHAVAGASASGDPAYLTLYWYAKT